MARDLSKATTFKDKVRPASAVSRWSMDNSDVDSGTVKDSWGSNDGIINGATTGVSGVGGGEAFSFDGSDDYVNFPSISLTSFTISLWVKADAWQNNWVIPVGEYNTNSNFIGRKDDNTWRVRTDDGTDHDISTALVDIGDWEHWIISYDRNVFRYFLNGTKAGEVSRNSKTFTVDCLGLPFNDFTYGFKGDLDEVRVYSEALNQQQIWKLYKIGRNANWGYSRS